MDGPTLECLVDCDLCGTKGLAVYVPCRTEDQSVVEWMEKVVLPALAQGHHMNNPNCRPLTLTQVKIPASEKGIGIPNDWQRAGSGVRFPAPVWWSACSSPCSSASSSG